MRIASLRVNGFGIFSGMEITGLSPSLNVFSGSNEAGKSTFLAFLRAMFFGFPRAGKGVNTYPPLNGGTHGGVLTLETPGGPVILARGPGPHGGAVSMTYADGSRGGPEDLRQLLAGATPQLFNAVYAFGLSELQTLSSLTSDEVAPALYGAGMGAGVQALAKARKTILQKKSALFKPTGSVPLINQAIAEWKDIQGRLTGAAQDSDRYREAAQRLAVLESQVKEVQAREGALRRDAMEADNTVKLWDDWISFSQAREKLAGLPPIPGAPPEDGVERLDRILEKAGECLKSLEEASRELDEQTAKARALDIEPALLEHAGEIAELAAGLEALAANLDETQEIGQSLESREREVRAILATLGPGWTLQRLENADKSLFARRDMDKHSQALEEAASAQSQAGRILEERVRDLESKGLAADECRKELAALGRVPGQWEASAATARQSMEARRAALKQTAGLVAAKQGMEQELRHLRDRLGDMEAFAHRRFHHILTAAMGGCFLALAAGSHWLNLPGYFSVSIVLAGIGSCILVMRRASRSAPPPGLGARLEKRDPRCQEARSKERAILEQIAAAQAAIRDIARDLGAACPESLQDVTQAQDALEQDMELFNRWEPAMRSLDAASRRVETALAGVESARDSLARAAANMEKAQEEWRAWLEEKGLPTDLSPLSAQDALRIMEQGCAAAAYAADLRAKLEQRRERAEQFRERSRRLFKSLGADAPEQDQYPAHIRDLADRLERSRTNFAARRQLEAGLPVLEKRIRASRQALATLEQEKKELFALAEAAGEEPFRQACLLAQEKKKWTACLDLAEANMGKISGETRLSNLIGRLESLSRSGVEARRQALQESLGQVEAEMQDMLREIAELKSRMGQLASDWQLSQLRTAKGEIEARMQGLAAQWGAYALAGYFLEQATARFEQEQQPAVITRASELFSQITQGRYTRILSPLGESAIEALAGDGTRRTTDQLSRATAEQLYLCLRMGYILNRSAQGQRLPVVMDDILVNFDPDRARQTARAIVRLAGGHQVLFFTCHPATRDLFKEIDKDACIIDLGHSQENPS